MTRLECVQTRLDKTSETCSELAMVVLSEVVVKTIQIIYRKSHIVKLEHAYNYL